MSDAIKVRRGKSIPSGDAGLEPVREELKPVSDVRAIDRTGCLRIYLTVIPVSLDDKPKQVRLAEHHKVTEKTARDLVTAFEVNNSFEHKTLARLSAVWLPYPVFL